MSKKININTYKIDNQSSNTNHWILKTQDSIAVNWQFVKTRDIVVIVCIYIPKDDLQNVIKHLSTIICKLVLKYWLISAHFFFYDKVNFFCD